MLFVCYPKCSTCAKARKWLEEQGISFEERDIKMDNPTEAELRDWHRRSGLPLKRFFNTSGLQYKALGLKDRLPAHISRGTTAHPQTRPPAPCRLARNYSAAPVPHHHNG